MRKDLLSEIEACSNRTRAIILTHNVDPFFVQSMLLRALRKCGHPSLTIFADGDSAHESYGRSRDMLVGLGSRYRLVPVFLGHRRRWHPKAVLLSGPDEATLWLGSGNLTFGGFRNNAEAWIRYDVAEDGLAPFTAVQGMLGEVVKDHLPPNEAVEREMRVAFSGRWNDQDPGPHRVAYRIDGPSLLDRVLGEQASEARSITLMAPYFGEIGAAVPAWRDRVGALSTAVRLSKVGHDLTEGAVSTWPPGTDILEIGDRERPRALVHAKGVLLEHTSGDTTAWVGSANLSWSAWLAEGEAGNAELVAEIKGAQAASLQDELAITGSFTPAKPRPSDDPAGDTRRLRILGARWTGRQLVVTWSGPACSSMTLLVDGDETPCEPANPLVVAASSPPSWLELRGWVGEEQIRSDHMWVDDEQALAAGAHTRLLTEAVDVDGYNARYQPDAWHRLMSHIARFVEPEEKAPSGGGTSSRTKEPEPFNIDFEELLVDGTRIPARGVSVGAMTAGLQDWIQRVLGVGDDDATDDDANSDDGDTDEEPVERRESLDSTPMTARSPTGIERKRIRAALDEVTAIMATRGWATQRGPKGVKSSLCLAGSLIGTAYCAEWLTAAEVAEALASTWPAVFFAPTGIPAYDSAEQKILETPDVAAALATWAYGACQVKDPLVALAARLRWASLMAHWPRVADPPAKEETVAAIHAIAGEDADHVLLARKETRALAGLLSELAARLKDPPTPWRDQLADLDSLEAGSLVWTRAFGVTTSRTHRGPRDKVLVVSLNASLHQSKFQARFLTPVQVLLDRGLITLSVASRLALDDLTAELTEAVS